MDIEQARQLKEKYQAELQSTIENINYDIKQKTGISPLIVIKNHEQTGFGKPTNYLHIVSIELNI